MPLDLLIVIALALFYGFLNGVRDAANIVATVISSRAFAPRTALTIAALAEFAGPFLFGVGVARTIGAQTVQAGALTLTVIIAALLGAIVWNMINGFFGIPGSSSHTLIGGIIGAVMVSAGWEAIKLPGLNQSAGCIVHLPAHWVRVWLYLHPPNLFPGATRNARINDFFKRSQLVTAIILGLSHGTNDAQKSMGIIVLGLVISGRLQSFEVPLWVTVASAASMAIGTSLAGWKIIRTLGGKFYKIRPASQFCNATDFRHRHPQRVILRRAGQHLARREFRHHRRRRIRAPQQSPLERGRRHPHSMADHDPGQRGICGRVLLAVDLFVKLRYYQHLSHTDIVHIRNIIRRSDRRNGRAVFDRDRIQRIARFNCVHSWG
jgi:PiT family inorganic phosphate transporter